MGYKLRWAWVIKYSCVYYFITIIKHYILDNIYLQRYNPAFISNLSNNEDRLSHADTFYRRSGADSVIKLSTHQKVIILMLVSLFLNSMIVVIHLYG